MTKDEAWNPSDTAYRPGGLPQDFIEQAEKQEPLARNTIEFRSACNAWVMRITADRRIEVNEDVEVTEAAQKVLDAMQHLLTPAAQPAVPDFNAFMAWANDAGYDIAHTHDGIKWLCLNPMTADLWKAWQAAHGITEEKNHG